MNSTWTQATNWLKDAKKMLKRLDTALESRKSIKCSDARQGLEIMIIDIDQAVKDNKK